MKKFLPYIFILVLLIGLFSLATKVSAGEPFGRCTIDVKLLGTSIVDFPKNIPGITKTACDQKEEEQRGAGYGSPYVVTSAWEENGPANLPYCNDDMSNGPANTNCRITSSTLGICRTGETASVVTRTTREQCQTLGGNWAASTIEEFRAAASVAATMEAGKKNFENTIENMTCTFPNLDIDICIIKFSYTVFFRLPAYLLALSAKLFNALLAISLSTNLYKSSFISNGWTVVRDFSNIFFILILLYIAIKIILDMGGHEAKQMIARVIIIAMLINFSMFFTKVVIDSSNILALIFYNKITTITQAGYSPTFDSSKTGVEEKDIAGGIAAAFNPSRFMSPGLIVAPITAGWWNGNFWSAMVGGPANQVLWGTAPSIILAIIFVSGLIFLFAAYAFLVAGLSFLGRLIELWILIIFSPFAFMSSAVPFLNEIEYLGWKAWFSRLLKTAFMAPIFIFFMFLIVKLIEGAFWKDVALSDGKQGQLELVLLIIIPGIIVLTMLLKATEFAKKGGGKFAEMAMTGLKVVGGLALGAVTGGTAMLAAGTVGRLGATVASSEWAKRREREGKFGGALIRSGAKALGSASFDVRAVKVGGKTLAGITGISMGEAQKGGFEERRKEQVEKRQKRARELQVGENEKMKQDLNKTEMDLQGLLGEHTQEIEKIDKTIEKARTEVNDANIRFNAAKGTGTQEERDALSALDKANDELYNAKEQKTALRRGEVAMLRTRVNGVVTTARTGTNYSNYKVNNRSIQNLEDDQKSQAQTIKTENVRRNQQYAQTQQSGWEQTKDFVFSGGQHSFNAAKEASYKIIMETKLDSGTKTT